MKKLTRMKLINWHRFENCTIDFDGSTLISGENGAGKSTLLDAIQFVILCSSNSFNKAAHEGGGRKLTGYIRCKSGKENQPYERSGQISAHVALEFYEESRDAYFIIGAAVDSASEGAEVTCRYLMDRARLDDEMFFQDSDASRTPRSIAQFRAANKNIKQWCKTQTEARKMVQSRLGRFEDKFFRLIPKALAFKPIDDIKDFVYSYVLDAKEVKIDALRENVRTYQELEQMLESVRRRIEKLEQIERFHTEVTDCLRRDRMYEYFLTRAQADIASQQAAGREKEIRTEEHRLESARREKEAKAQERSRAQEMEMNLQVELRQDQDFLALEEQKRQLGQLRHEETECRADLKALKDAAYRSLALIEKLLAAADGQKKEHPSSAAAERKPLSGAGGEGQTQAPAANPPQNEDPAACLREYRRLFSKAEKIEDTAQAKDVVERVIVYKRAQYEELQQELAGARILLSRKEDELRDLQKRIAGLERRKLSYPEGTERLIAALREEFARLDRRSQPHVLCEVLEIADEEWRNAVEGYLNTQRFYIIVEPDNYDLALGIYERLRREGKVYGVGLINARKLGEYNTAPPDTLAAKVETGNRYARRYVNMILGKVHLCSRVEDLKNYSIAITKECMRYQNRVASAIRPEVFSVPFIGKHAYKVQLEQARQQEKQLKAEATVRRNTIRQQEEILQLLSTEYEVDVKFRLDVLPRMAALQSAVRQCEESIRALEQNTTMIQKRIQLQELEEQRRTLENAVDNLIGTIAQLETTIRFKRTELDQLKWQETEQRAALTQLTDQAGEELALWEKEYARQTSDKSYEQFRFNYERQRKANETNRQKAEAQMTDRMIEYKTAHDFGAAPNMSGYPEFAAVYDRLVTSELLEYEDKVQSAKEAAEVEFREQFLSKLQENMKQAQNEFRSLNRALRDITFSNDRYEFLCMPGKRNRGFYEMIMSDYNIEGGQSLFSGVFYERYREVIDELFRRLTGQSGGEGEILEEYTDYRTYMDYDIRILHGDGTCSLYSKVCEEKSGGETQTPFYVTVAASFVQLYGNSLADEAAGLVLFDEAFNNMDDERIGGVLEFMNRLPLQIIISAPPEKIQYIAPKMSETLLIMTDEKVSYVEEYHVGN